MSAASAVIAAIGRVLAPREAALHDGGTGGEISLSTSGTAVRIQIPTWLRGRYVDVTSFTTDCSIIFGGASVDVVYGAVNTVTDEAVTLSDTVGRTIVAGSTRTMLVPSGCTHMACEASGAGRLEIGSSSSKVDGA